MRPVRSCRAVWFLGIWLALAGPWVRADATTRPAPDIAPSAATASDPDSTLQRALDLERQHKWAAAIEAYEAALEQWPDRTEFRHRLRLCEAHYKLSRRYQDRSFRNQLLQLPREKALQLYEEVLERIEANYVEPVALEPLLRRGLDNLEVALRDPIFLQGNGVSAPAERIKWLRDAYGTQRARVHSPRIEDAKTFVLSCCDLAQKTVGIRPAPIILEFTFGACDALDDYTSYLTPDKLDDLFATIDGNFVGLGVELKADEAGMRLVGVIPGGPAAEAGLRVGDRITHVNGLAVRGLGLDEAASRLQGPEGTTVEIEVLQADGTSRRYKLVRRPVEIQSIAQARLVDPTEGVGYIQLSGFQKNSTEELQRAIAALQRQGMRYLILDLRGNPGGLLNVAVEMAEKFLDSGVIVSTRGRAPGQTSTYRAHHTATWRMPLAILIDHDSASASEILAGALQENRRAVVLGERSYGKGSVQSIFPLRTAPAGLKLTTARFYSPRNRAYSEQGVEPDIAVKVRVAAKPADPGATAPQPQPTIEFGNRMRDPVLEAALRQAKRQFSAVR
ncbi:MAG: S41 family peptidase [Isosphaeraceae bacterium]|nr:S41 family peptidase [Isosphaeraceae bacterium]